MNRTLRTTICSFVALAVALVAIPFGAEAQVQQQEQEPPQPPDREELERFANGLIDVTEIQAEMEQALASVQDPEEANQIQQAANQRMIQALEEYELTPERYSEIVMLLNADEDLQEEFEEVYEEVLEERDGDGDGARPAAA